MRSRSAATSSSTTETRRSAPIKAPSPQPLSQPRSRQREDGEPGENEDGTEQSSGADPLVEHDHAEHGGGERLGEHERRHLGGVEAPEAAREQRVRERGRDDAEVEREGEPVRRVQPRGISEHEHREEQHGAEAE